MFGNTFWVVHQTFKLSQCWWFVFQALGISTSKDRDTLKKKIKEVKVNAEREKKLQEKERKLKEKEQKRMSKKKWGDATLGLLVSDIVYRCVLVSGRSLANFERSNFLNIMSSSNISVWLKKKMLKYYLYNYLALQLRQRGRLPFI